MLGKQHKILIFQIFFITFFLKVTVAHFANLETKRSRNGKIIGKCCIHLRHHMVRVLHFLKIVKFVVPHCICCSVIRLIKHTVLKVKSNFIGSELGFTPIRCDSAWDLSCYSKQGKTRKRYRKIQKFLCPSHHSFSPAW